MRGLRLVLGVLAIAAVAMGARMAVGQPFVAFEPFVTGLNAPLAMRQPQGDDRLFVIEQDGRVRIIADGELQPEPFHDIRDRMVEIAPDFDERGLLGLAFHPEFTRNGLFYLAYSRALDPEFDVGEHNWRDHENVVSEFRVDADDPGRADPDYERVLSSMRDWPQFNHQGHWIDIGPDLMLYVSIGDGGDASEWNLDDETAVGNSQNMMAPLGKVLRLTLDGEAPDDNPFVGRADVLPEIFAAGLRNAWRCSFDRGGERRLFCGDVGQNAYEEVNVIEAGGNYGWRRMEASHCFDHTAPDAHPPSCDTAGLTLPILEYNNCNGNPEGCLGISVTGGYVYRGTHAEWDGKYIFGDWSRSFGEMDGQVFFGTKHADGTWSMQVATVTNKERLPYILAFGQDADGEVYALTSVTTGPVGRGDTIYRIVPAD